MKSGAPQPLFKDEPLFENNKQTDFIPIRRLNRLNIAAITLVNDTTVAVAERNNNGRINTPGIFMWDLTANTYTRRYDLPPNIFSINALYLGQDPNSLICRYVVPPISRPTTMRQAWNLANPSQRWPAQVVTPTATEATSVGVNETFSLMGKYYMTKYYLGVKSKPNSNSYVGIYAEQDDGTPLFHVIQYTPYLIRSVQYNGRYLFLEMTSNAMEHFIAVLEIKFTEDYIQQNDHTPQREKAVKDTLTMRGVPTELSSLINSYARMFVPAAITPTENEPAAPEQQIKCLKSH